MKEAENIQRVVGLLGDAKGNVNIRITISDNFANWTVEVWDGCIPPRCVDIRHNRNVAYSVFAYREADDDIESYDDYRAFSEFEMEASFAYFAGNIKELTGN